MSSAGIAAPAPSKTRHTTSYVVLERDQEGKSFTPVATVKAANARKAIRDHLAAQSKTTGVFVAVTARAWQPVTAKTETKTTVKLD